MHPAGSFDLQTGTQAQLRCNTSHAATDAFRCVPRQPELRRRRCIRLQHLESFEFRSLLRHELVGEAPRSAIIETVLARLERNSAALPSQPRRYASSAVKASFVLTGWSRQDEHIPLLCRAAMQFVLCAYCSYQRLANLQCIWQPADCHMARAMLCAIAIICALTYMCRVPCQSASRFGTVVLAVAAACIHGAIHERVQAVQGRAALHLGDRPVERALPAARHPQRALQPGWQRPHLGAQPHRGDAVPSPHLLRRAFSDQLSYGIIADHAVAFATAIPSRTKPLL